MKEDAEKAQAIIAAAEKLREEIIRKADEDAKKIREDAKAKSKIKPQTSDDFRTPEERIRRAGSDDQASLVQNASASPAPSPASSETSGAASSSEKQTPLHNFLKSPASTSNKVIPNPQFSKRVQEPKEMKVLRHLQEKYDDQILNQDQETSLVQKKTMSWKEFGRMGGRPSATAREELRGLAGGKRSNRKGHVEESRKKEFTAYQKMKIVEASTRRLIKDCIKIREIRCSGHQKQRSWASVQRG